ncbi:WASP homolog-associated protein with actin, membranes and microtubules [Ornithorhynchus anatinus]|uniref:WASP homolog-associated protein with actin, membranes and microtubules n=1 Tax=Ornithorhynchus anatinus TaxID=9258 RepID=UPI0019D4E21F|nr:WASP homolog-associated protein with actin, membranes and microtubules [Ornithorhynchus anatinus]
MEAEERADSLEGWVSVRERPFDADPRPPRLRFLVWWSPQAGRFAVTCPSRGPPPAGLLSVAALRGLHGLLLGLWPRPEPRLPALPAGLGTGPAGPEELRPLCRELEGYLAAAAAACGPDLLLDALFPAEDPADREPAYFEPPDELRRRTLRGRLDAARGRLRAVLQIHGAAETLVTLLKVYEEEDEAYRELVSQAADLYHYLLRPFRDMRELATFYKLEILKSLKTEELGPRRRAELKKEAENWRLRAEEAVTSIQEITVDYFKETVKALAAMQKQMEEDGKRFGSASWASATPRLEKVKLMSAQETLQLMRAKELCANQKRADIRKKMKSLSEQERSVDAVDELEIQYYEAQLESYKVQFEILKYEERLLVLQLETVRRLLKEKQDEVVYYDTCENPEELKGLDQTVDQQNSQNPEWKKLNLQLRQLESKRGIICSRRAYLRNKKDQCEESHQLKVRQAQESHKHFLRHHGIQLKRDKKKEEEREKREWINQEYQKTLQRLKTFREKRSARSGQKASGSDPVGPSPHLDDSPPTVSADAQPLSLIFLSPGLEKSPPSDKGQSGRGQGGSEGLPEQTLAPTGEPGEEVKTPQASPLLTPPASPSPSAPPPPPPPPLPVHPPPPFWEPTKVGEKPFSADKFRDPPRSRCSGLMDEVLASLKQGNSGLRHVEPPHPPGPGTSGQDDLLAAIRRGVKLRRVTPGPAREAKASNSELERSIKAAMRRIKKVSADSEEEDDGEQNSGGEWDG